MTIVIITIVAQIILKKSINLMIIVILNVQLMIGIVNYAIPQTPANVVIIFKETKKTINFEQLNAMNIANMILGEEKVNSLIEKIGS